MRHDASRPVYSVVIELVLTGLDRRAGAPDGCILRLDVWGVREKIAYFSIPHLIRSRYLRLLRIASIHYDRGLRNQTWSFPVQI